MLDIRRAENAGHDFWAVFETTPRSPGRDPGAFPAPGKQSVEAVVICTFQCPSVHSGGVVEVLDKETLEPLVDGTIPTEQHGNHEWLFTLARPVKAFATGRPAPLGEPDWRAVFSLWHERAAGFLRADQAWDQYYEEFLQAYEDVKRPGGDAVVDNAWPAISTANHPWPPEAALVVDARIKNLVAL